MTPTSDLLEGHAASPVAECSEETSNHNPSIEEPAEDLTEEFVEQTVRTPSHKEPPTIDR